MIQKEFKITPSYMEISEHDEDDGYHMGVFICMGENIVNVDFADSKPFSAYGTFEKIQEELTNNNGELFIFLGEGKHKIKKKAEQTACRLAIEQIKKK